MTITGNAGHRSVQGVMGNKTGARSFAISSIGRNGITVEIPEQFICKRRNAGTVMAKSLKEVRAFLDNPTIGGAAKLAKKGYVITKDNHVA